MRNIEKLEVRPGDGSASDAIDTVGYNDNYTSEILDDEPATAIQHIAIQK